MQASNDHTDFETATVSHRAGAAPIQALPNLDRRADRGSGPDFLDVSVEPA
jgi:hypothetical protein